MTFQILFVCTGNICRSPLAEHVWNALIARRHLRGGAEAVASSAGTRALVGHPMTPQTVDLVVREGAGPGGHRARALTPDLIQAADAVLTMTREHRTAVALMHPPAVHRSFTVREAARLAASAGGLVEGEGPAERWTSLLPALRVTRGSGRAPAEGEDDIVDPFGRSVETYARSAGQILPALTTLLDLVAPLVPSEDSGSAGPGA